MAFLLCMYIYSIINFFIAWGIYVGPEGMLSAIPSDQDRSVCDVMFQSVQFNLDLFQHLPTSVSLNCPPERKVIA